MFFVQEAVATKRIVVQFNLCIQLILGPFDCTHSFNEARGIHGKWWSRVDCNWFRQGLLQRGITEEENWASLIYDTTQPLQLDVIPFDSSSWGWDGGEGALWKSLNCVVLGRGGWSAIPDSFYLMWRIPSSALWVAHEGFTLSPLCAESRTQFETKALRHMLLHFK